MVPKANTRIRIPIYREENPMARWLDDGGNNVSLANLSPFDIAELDGYCTGTSTMVKKSSLPQPEPINATGTLWNTKIGGSTMDTIFWGYKNNIKAFKDNFEKIVDKSSLEELKEYRDAILRFDGYPVNLYNFISQTIQIRRTEQSKRTMRINDTVWFRIKVKRFEVDDEGCPLEFPLGKYEEVYMECDKLNELDEVMTFHYGVNVFDLDIFELTIMDGDSVFERYVNNSKAAYNVFNKANVEQTLNNYRNWIDA